MDIESSPGPAHGVWSRYIAVTLQRAWGTLRDDDGSVCEVRRLIVPIQMTTAHRPTRGVKAQHAAFMGKPPQPPRGDTNAASVTPKHTRPCRQTYIQTHVSHVYKSLGRRWEPLFASPLASPRLAAPRLAGPRLATRQPSPSPAAPTSRGGSERAEPPQSPCIADTRLTGSSWASLSQSTPRRAYPASPRIANPRRTAPRNLADQASPRLA